MGDKYKDEGEKALARSTIFGFGKSKKYEDAAEFFTKAGNAYKMESKHAEAGEMFKRAAEAQLVLDSKTDAANAYVEAANCFKKGNVLDAVDPFLKAIEIYAEGARFSQLARYYKEIAEIYEQEKDNLQAIEYFKKAADANENDHKKQAANQCLAKVATLAAAEGDFLGSAKVFEKLASDSLDSKLGQYSARGFFLQAGLCILAAGDNVAASNQLQSFKSKDFNFPSSRECQFLENLLKAIENYNSDEFAQVCADFDRITPLDPWKTNLLVQIKKGLQSGDEVDLT